MIVEYEKYKERRNSSFIQIISRENNVKVIKIIRNKIGYIFQ